MIELTFSPFFIYGNEIIFYGFLGIISLVIIITILIVLKEIRGSNVSK